jgi:hypothetical protein
LQREDLQDLSIGAAQIRSFHHVEPAVTCRDSCESSRA